MHLRHATTVIFAILLFVLLLTLGVPSFFSSDEIISQTTETLEQADAPFWQIRLPHTVLDQSETYSLRSNAMDSDSLEQIRISMTVNSRQLVFSLVNSDSSEVVFKGQPFAWKMWQKLSEYPLVEAYPTERAELAALGYRILEQEQREGSIFVLNSDGVIQDCEIRLQNSAVEMLQYCIETASEFAVFPKRVFYQPLEMFSEGLPFILEDYDVRPCAGQSDETESDFCLYDITLKSRSSAPNRQGADTGWILIVSGTPAPQFTEELPTGTSDPSPAPTAGSGDTASPMPVILAVIQLTQENLQEEASPSATQDPSPSYTPASTPTPSPSNSPTASPSSSPAYTPAPTATETAREPTTSPTSAPAPGCGNGIYEPAGADGISGTTDDEECDDGFQCTNSLQGACCPSGENCLSTLPSSCDPIVGAEIKCERRDNDHCTNDCRKTFCGDGIVSPKLLEQCDDGGTCSNQDIACTSHADCTGGVCLPQNGDGCDENCQVERCGNGVVQPLLGETCDNGSRCEFTGQDCSLDPTSCPSIEGIPQQYCQPVNTKGCAGCRPTCGDGNLTRLYDEECDPGSKCDVTGEDCSRDPLVCTWQGQPMPQWCNTTPTQDCTVDCRAICGNGKIDGEEECDPGRSCEDGTDCTEFPNICQSLGGCQVRNRNNCSTDCKILCGNGQLDADQGEECDPGSEYFCKRFGAACDPEAQTPCGPFGPNDCVQRLPTTCDDECHLTCGDGIVDENEFCDPGLHCADGQACNAASGCLDGSDCIVRGNDQCDKNCQNLCGNGSLDEGEQCDAGSQCVHDAGGGHIFFPEEPIDCTDWPARCSGTLYRICTPNNTNECGADCRFSPRCGDGQVDPAGADGIAGNEDDEQCDEGGQCSAGERAGEPCSHSNECGQGECLPIAGESCDTNCKFKGFCGDGVTQPDGPDGIYDTADDEECDDGGYCSNSDVTCNFDFECLSRSCEPREFDGCDVNCKREYCGDGIVQYSLGEQCDPEPRLCCDEQKEHCEGRCSTWRDCPANRSLCTRPQQDDHCSFACTLKCGNGNVDFDAGEECDPGSYCPDGTPCSPGFVNPCEDGQSCLPAATVACTVGCKRRHACCDQNEGCKMVELGSCTGTLYQGDSCEQNPCASPSPDPSVSPSSSPTWPTSSPTSWESTTWPTSTPN